ncbi:hypothetical protein HPB47_015248 [Ixodes persulcatus]|uniref:Uncharacterized protein n=1 Tax=Ixodes persulcatus TaxID=34615 RepID=A0AC60QTZ2_IXOPE|nr:hypothetical protein HPB47_015248 [Ixodes persulcatus]
MWMITSYSCKKDLPNFSKIDNFTHSMLAARDEAIKQAKNDAELLTEANMVQITIDISGGGQFIPKDTGILYNIYAMNHDSGLWDDPDIFRPERFLDPVTGKVKHEVLPQLMSFGLGPRTCPGEKLAYVDMFYVFVRFMQRVDISAPEGKANTALEPVRSNLFLFPWEENIVLTRKD